MSADRDEAIRRLRVASLAACDRLAALVDEPADDARSLRPLAVALKSAFDAVRQHGDKLASPARHDDGWRQVVRATEALEEFATADDGAMTPSGSVPVVRSDSETFDLGEFFQSVSRSLLTAQEDLNDRSLEYARQLAATGRDAAIPPSYFSIPAVKAEMKVGFSRTEDQGFDVLFFKNEQEKRDYGESTVSFELLASPAPPGPTTYPGGLTVAAPAFLVVGDERQVVLDGLRSLPRNQGGGEPAAALRDSEPLALAFRLPPGQDGVQRYLIAWPVPRRTSTPVKPWSRFRVHALARAGDGFASIGDQVFSNGQHVLDLTTEARAAQGEPAKLAIAFGDAMNLVALSVQGWLASVSAPAPPGAGDGS